MSDNLINKYNSCYNGLFQDYSFTCKTDKKRACQISNGGFDTHALSLLTGWLKTSVTVKEAEIEEEVVFQP